MTDLERILHAVLSESGVQRHAVLGPRRGKKPIAEARQLGMYLSRKLLPHQSLTSIGEFYQRDRTTVRHAVEKYNKNITPEVKKLEARLARTIFPVHVGQ